ncbi:hypothetical protein FHG87_008876 [Trinorchestia longiramus]|nr:hypothetical protein FHG87_008876 [Trinorchestia longiramus]
MQQLPATLQRRESGTAQGVWDSATSLGQRWESDGHTASSECTALIDCDCFEFLSCEQQQPILKNVERSRSGGRHSLGDMDDLHEEEKRFHAPWGMGVASPRVHTTV